MISTSTSTDPPLQTMLLNEPIFISTQIMFRRKNLFVRLFCAEKNGIELKTREEALSSEIKPYIFIIMHSVIAFGILTRAKMSTFSFV